VFSSPKFFFSFKEIDQEERGQKKPTKQKTTIIIFLGKKQISFFSLLLCKSILDAHADRVDLASQRSVGVVDVVGQDDGVPVFPLAPREQRGRLDRHSLHQRAIEESSNFRAISHEPNHKGMEIHWTEEKQKKEKKHDYFLRSFFFS